MYFSMNSRLPLLDLHRHLDGNVRLSTILELGQQLLAVVAEGEDVERE